MRAFARRHRRLLWMGLVLGVVLIALAQPPAGADSDVFDSTGPPSQVGGGAKMNEFPISRYALDLHIPKSAAGPIDLPDVPKLILFSIADILWQATAFLTFLVIQLFTFAFSLDLLQGSAATNGQGALEPVSRAVKGIYGSTFGEPFLVLAIVAVGLWGVKTGLAQRRTSELVSGLATSLAFAVIALWFVTNPVGSVGFIADKSNELSGAFLSVSSKGEVVGKERAKNEASDTLFQTHIVDPWLVLNFGGTRHCVTKDSLKAAEGVDKDKIDDTLVSTNAYPRDGPDEKGRARKCYDNSRYAGSYLFFTPTSPSRTATDTKSSYNAINAGDAKQWPDGQDGTTALPDRYKPALDRGDVAAVSMQESGGVTQRLGTALVIGLANLGMIVLVAALSIAVVLAQVLALLLLLFAPAALVIGIFPGRGHDFFRNWLVKLLTALFRKAIYSFVLAVLLAAAAALAAAATELGWLMAFGLQATFYWMVFLYRKQILSAFTAATTAGQADEGGGRAVGGAVRTAWSAPSSLATAAAGAAMASRGRGDGGADRENVRADRENVGAIRDWVARKRTGAAGAETPRADDREEGEGRRLDWSSGDGGDAPEPDPVHSPSAAGGGGDGGNGGGPPAVVTPGPTGRAVPGGDDPDLADRSPNGHGRDGRPGRAGGTGPAGPPSPGASSPPGASTSPTPAPGREPPRTGRDGGGDKSGRGGGYSAGRPGERSTPPPGAAPSSPGAGAPSPAGGQQQRPSQQRPPAQRPPTRGGGGGGGGGAPQRSQADRDVERRIKDLEGKSGRSAGERQELDRLRDWRRKSGGGR